MREIKFKKWRILLAILTCIAMIVFCFFFVTNPKLFLRNIFSREWHIQVIGVLGGLFLSATLYSMINILTRKYAIRITKEALIDNSRYESFGILKWSDIRKTRRLEKRSIEIFLKEERIASEKQNIISKFLSFGNNWRYKESIIISSGLLNCTAEELYELISTFHKKYK